MKISTKGQYALEALIDLVMHAEDGQESLKNVAGRRAISEPYLDQIFNMLRRAGIVESIRGAQGGYRLTREPRAITAGEIVRAAEGSLAPVKCVNGYDEDGNRCQMFDRCVTRPLWARVAFEIDSTMDCITLADLAECASPSMDNGTQDTQYSI